MTPLKILLVGSDQVWSLEKIYMRYLLEEGVNVELFAAQNLFYAYNNSLINKVMVRLGIAGIYRSINEALRSRILAFKPDIVWVFKGMEVMPETIEWIRAQGIIAANYNPDNPFIFSGRGSGNKYVTQSIGLFDLHFTYNLEVLRRLKEEYKLQTVFLPFGFELSDVVFQLAVKEEEIGKVCFLGNPDAGRAVYIKELLGAGIPVDLYGNEWEKFVEKHSLMRSFPAVYGDEFWKVLRRYRVQLNLMRIHNEDSHNMRSFEVPGVGGIMLAPATTEHRLFFKDGEEAFLFGSAAEAIEKARQILDLPTVDADKIRMRARQRSLESGYTYQQRTKDVLQELKRLHAEAGHHSI